MTESGAIRNRKGMTRQDIVLAVGVGIAVVAVLIVMGVRNANKQASIRDTESRMAMLRTAIEQYQLEIGAPPQRLSDLTISHSETLASPFLTNSAALKDAWDSPFSYAILLVVETNRSNVVTSNRQHRLVSRGLDMQESTADDIIVKWHAEQSPSPYR